MWSSGALLPYFKPQAQAYCALSRGIVRALAALGLGADSVSSRRLALLHSKSVKKYCNAAFKNATLHGKNLL